MNQKNKNKKTHDFLIKEVRVILKEQDEWDGWFSAETFGKFISPFTDVLNVAKVAIKDVLVSTINVAKQVTTFDLKKKREIEDKYRQAKKEIESEYAEAMKPIDDALAGNDVKMLAFAMNPGLFMATSLAKGAAAAGKPILNYASEKLDLAEFRPDDDTNKDRDDRKNAADGGGGGKGPLLGLMGDLNKIFFSPLETAKDLIMASDDPLHEQDPGLPSEKVNDQTLEIAEAMLKDMGIWKGVQAAGEKRLRDKLAEIKELEDEFSAVMNLIAGFRQAETLEQVKEAASSLNSHGLDISQQVVAVEKAIKDQMTALRDDKSNQIKKDLLSTKSPISDQLTPESPAEAFLPIIEKTIIAASLQEALENVREDMFKQIMNFAAEGMTRKELSDVASVSPLGKQFSTAVMGLASRLANK
jgi:hypothetical protein